MDMFCHLELQANFRNFFSVKEEIKKIQDDIWRLRLRLIAMPDSRAYRKVTISKKKNIS